MGIYRFVLLSFREKGLPYLDIGDYIDVIDNDGNTRHTYILRHTISGIQALKGSIESSCEKKKSESFGLNKQVIQLAGKTNTLERTVNGTLSKVEDLETGYSVIEQKSQ